MMYSKQVYILFLLAFIPLSSELTLEKLIGLPTFRSIRTLINRKIGRTSENPAILERSRQLNVSKNKLNLRTAFIGLLLPGFFLKITIKNRLCYRPNINRH